jgi:hemolysin III
MPNNTEWLKYHSTLLDGGPLYTETDLGHLIVEPWNAISSLAFLIPAIYWLWKVKFDIKKYLIMVICGVLLFVGGTGSTLFHAFRTSHALIVMDFLPMAMATFAVSCFFWYKVLYQKWYWVATIVVPTWVIREQLFYWLNHHNAINVSYFLTGTMIFLPMLLLLYNTNWFKSMDALMALFGFAIALFFRQIDAWDPPITPIGTHFLWHLFGAGGSFYLAKYLYALSTVEIQETVAESV